MLWNWQRKDWPQFSYDKASLGKLETQFLHKSGILVGTYKHVNTEDQKNLLIDILSDEALKTSAIEGEILNRQSVQSSLRRQFGLNTDSKKIPPAEQGIAEMMVNLHQAFNEPLTQECLFSWHKMLMKGRHDLDKVGAYRKHEDPMQVISGAVHNPIVHFEAPPSKDVSGEMKEFIAWFNETAPSKHNSLPVLTRAGISHLYFVCIHPFEDGNGRIGRAISEKALSQHLKQPTLIALSHTIEKHRKSYYDALENNNKTLDITDWLLFFANTILQAQDYTMDVIDFLIAKTKLYDRVKGQLNERQEKVIARMFREGLEGFKGGLSAENYLTITSTSRATATRDLQDLVNLGVLNRTGERKSTRYYLNLKAIKFS